MHAWRMPLWGTALLVVLVTGAGCSSYTAVQRLSPPEQTEFFTYRKVMTWSQRRTYLAKTTPAERTAYLQTSGLAQRFQALDPLDRDAILAGSPRLGMHADALLFLWGSPHYMTGRPHYYEHWYYLGSSFDLATTGSVSPGSGMRVEVRLERDRVLSWLDYTPTNDDNGSDNDWGS